MILKSLLVEKSKGFFVLQNLLINLKSFHRKLQKIYCTERKENYMIKLKFCGQIYFTEKTLEQLNIIY